MREIKTRYVRDSCFSGIVEAGKRKIPTWAERFVGLTMPAMRVFLPSLHIHGDVIAKGYIKVVTEGLKGVRDVLGVETRVLSSKQMK